jgi:CRP/FNR family transcriptional regulator, cyclic AMP receptor protein
MSIIHDAVGTLASALVFTTFTMKDMRTLRLVAIFSNIAFITYGSMCWILPILGLHLLLLPLNLHRLMVIRATQAREPVARNLGPASWRKP